jgi:hypothetical protein
MRKVRLKFSEMNFADRKTPKISVFRESEIILQPDTREQVKCKFENFIFEVSDSLLAF